MRTLWLNALLLILPAWAFAQGQALDRDPMHVWEGTVDYAATGATFLDCQPTACLQGLDCQVSASASAVLDLLPEGEGVSIEWAQLTWFGVMPAGQAIDGSVDLALPGAAPFAVPAGPTSEVFVDGLPAGEAALIGILGCGEPQGTDYTFYAQHADVTQSLQAHLDGGGSLNGEYTVSGYDAVDITTGDPTTLIASIASLGIGGWSVLVVYRDEARPSQRRVYYYQGFELNEGTNRTVRARGFRAPPNPVVDVSFLVLEGDQGITGDSLTINGQEVSDPCNPQRNVFNSTVNTGRADGVCQQGVHGVDLDTFTVDDALDPGDTEAEVTFVVPRGDGLLTAGEQLFTTWLILAFDHQPAEFGSVKPEKTAFPPHQSVVQPNDVITYSILVHNIGGDFASNVTVTDAIPEGTRYVPGSLAVDLRPVVDGPGGAFPLAAGLNLSRLPEIDLIGPGDRHVVEFQVQVMQTVVPPMQIQNVARIDADDLEPAFSDQVLHHVGERTDAGPPPLPDFGVSDASVSPPLDGSAPQDAGPREDANAQGCPPGQRPIDRLEGACEPIECPDGSVLEGESCIQPSEPCGAPGTTLGPDGICISVCGPGLRWDSTCSGGGQCRHEAEPLCNPEAAGSADSGCSCDVPGGDGQGPVLWLMALGLGLGWRRRSQDRGDFSG